MVDLRDAQGRRWQISIGSGHAMCDEQEVTNPHTFEIDARPNRIWVDNRLAHAVKVGDDWWVHLNGAIHIVSIDEQGASGTGEADGMIAPMPGKVIDLKVKVGSKIKKGDTLVVLEAMKMEHTVKAVEDGVIDELFVSQNDQVENGALLMVIKK